MVVADEKPDLTQTRVDLARLTGELSSLVAQLRVQVDRLREENANE